MQEHIKNCKECGNGFYWQGLEVCHDCKVNRQGGYFTQWTNAERQATAAQNHYPLNCENKMNNDQQLTPEEIKAHQKKWAAIAGSKIGRAHV